MDGPTNMKRRAFLETILGTVALAIVPDLDYLALQEARLTTPEAIGEVWSSAYRRVLAETARLYAQEVAQLGLPIAQVHPQQARLGECLPSGLLVRDWFCVGMSGRPNEQTVSTAMTALAHEALRRGVDEYTSLAPVRNAEWSGQAGPLRLTVMFDLYDQQLAARFDVAGASSPRGLVAKQTYERSLERERQRRLVATIQQRLADGRYGRVLPIP